MFCRQTTRTQWAGSVKRVQAGDQGVEEVGVGASRDELQARRRRAGPATVEIRDLTVSYRTDRESVLAVDSVDLDLAHGETLALVGESGCGKSTLGATIAGALPEKTAEVGVGLFRIAGIDLGADTSLANPLRRDARIGLISQDAMGSLDPCFAIGTQLSETYRLWHEVTRREARSRAVEYLEYVGLPDASRLRKHFPHQLSGGMRQRVAIALSLMMDPTVLVADEATTALDVTIQSEIVDLLLSIQGETGMAILFITHDLALAGEVADRIAVMYAARIVERGTAEEVMQKKLHPYTRALMGLIPRGPVDSHPLTSIPGAPPLLTDRANRCRFVDRCAMAMDICRSRQPAPTRLSDGQIVECHLYGDNESAG